MNQILSNLAYFNISKLNPEPLLDENYIFVEIDKNIEKYIENNRQIKNILITIRTLQINDEEQKVIDKYFLELSKIISKFSNCSEFSCFVNACDNIIFETKNEIDLLKLITERYFRKRILNEAVPEEWIQALIDNNSSRKKGKCGENKLIKILERKNFIEVFNWEDFSKNEFCVLKFSKKFNLTNVQETLKIEIRTTTQNKTLDLIIKLKNNIFILEAKHLNTGGGGQNKQISELIEIINLQEKNNNISFVAFLDGKHSNTIFGTTNNSSKLETQRAEIISALNKNPHNYWVNTAGFEALIDSYL